MGIKITNLSNVVSVDFDDILPVVVDTTSNGTKNILVGDLAKSQVSADTGNLLDSDANGLNKITFDDQLKSSDADNILAKGSDNKIRLEVNADLKSSDPNNAISKGTDNKIFVNGNIATPIGIMFDFGNSSPPTGFLECDGSEISQTTYSELFNVIGSNFVDEWTNGDSITSGDLRKSIADGTIYEATSTGTTNGTDIGDDIGITWILATTFLIPDRRGVFGRGWDNGRGLDSGRVFGSLQTDDFKSHVHGRGESAGTNLIGGASGAFVRTVGQSASDTDATGGTETRPKNLSVLVCIKY